MMKKEYEIPEFVIYRFDNEDVITTSYGDNNVDGSIWDATTVPEV